MPRLTALQTVKHGDIWANRQCRLFIAVICGRHASADVAALAHCAVSRNESDAIVCVDHQRSERPIVQSNVLWRRLSPRPPSYSLLAVASAWWATYKLLNGGRPQPAQEAAALRWWLLLALLPLFNTWVEWAVSWLPFYPEVS
jgi:hypothetical protein